MKRVGNIDWSFTSGENCFIWQYANALRINQIIRNEIEFYNKNVIGFIEDWTRDVFNLETANSFGLDVWGKILNAPRPHISPQNYIIDTNTTLRIFNVDNNAWHSIWLSGSTPTLKIETTPPAVKYNTILLNDEAYRRCLRAKILLLNSNASVNDINRFLEVLFPNRGVYVQDNYDMTMSIVFPFIPTDIDLTIITYEAFSPRPMGVYMNYGVNLLTKNTFAFSEMELGTWGTPDGTNDPDIVRQGLGTFYNL